MEKELKEAIQLTQSLISSKNHAFYDLAQKAILGYQKQLNELTEANKELKNDVKTGN